jgi:hypothetical protein
MGIAAVAEDLAGRDELEELFRLDASESDPEDDEDDVDEDEDDVDEDDDEDDEGVRPEGMPHD